MSLARRRMREFSVLALVSALVGAWLYTLLGAEEETAPGPSVIRPLWSPTLSTSLLEQIISVQLNNPSGRYVLSRQSAEANWHVALGDGAPVPADSAAVVGLLTMLRDSRQELLPVGDLDPNSLGLKPGGLSVSLRTLSGATETLLVGRRNAYNATVYVQSSKSQRVGITGGALLYQLKMNFFQLREKRLLPVEKKRISAVTVTHAHSSYSVRRRVRGAEDWSITAESAGQGRPVDPKVMEQLLATVARLRAGSIVRESAAEEYLQEYGLSGPVLRIELTLFDGSTVAVSLSSPQGRGDKATTYAHAEGTTVIAAVSSPRQLEFLYTPAEQLEDRRLMVFVNEQVFSVVLQQGHERTVLRRKDQIGTSGDDRRWHITEPTEQDANGAEVFGLLFNLSIVRFAEDSVPQRRVPAAGEVAQGAAHFRLELRGEEGDLLAGASFAKAVDAESHMRQARSLGTERWGEVLESTFGRLHFEAAHYAARGAQR